MAANPQAQIQAALMPAALPQEIVPVTTRKSQIQYTQYDPDTVQAYKNAMLKTAPRAGVGELIAQALGGMSDAPSYEGAYGTQVISPIASALTNALRAGGSIYGAKKENERGTIADRLAAEQDLARLEMEMGKQTVTNEIMDDYIKRNVDQNSAGVAEKFAPENLQRLNDLNKEAGRFPTNWAKDLADIANTKQSQAYNEFEGLAKQYVQDQLRKIYGAQFTEAEGERFFQSMGLSPKLDPEVRWRLVENALADVARKNGLQLPMASAGSNDLMAQFMNGTI